LAMHVEHRVRAEVADARLDLQAAVRLDDEQAVESDRAARVRAHGDADAARLVALATRGGEHRLARFPLELVAALVERFLHERARHVGRPAVGPRGSEWRVARRRVDLPHLDLIEPELSR